MTEIAVEPQASPSLSTPWVPLWPLAPSTLGELAYAERGTNVTVDAASGAAAVTVLTLPEVILDGQTPVEIEFYSFQVTTPPVATAAIVLTLWDGSTDLGTIAQPASPTAASMYLPVSVSKRFTPEAGAHTFSIRAWRTGGSDGAIGAGGGVPIWARIKLVMPTAAPVSNPTYGTTFPASPANGQEHILVDSVTNPSYQWRFRYNASSTSPYKWEFVGGAPAFIEVATSEATASAALVDLATVGPQFIFPRAGDYMTTHGGWMNAAAAASGAMSLGSATESAYGSLAASGHYQVSTRKNRLVGRTAGQVVKVQYASILGNSITFANRFLEVLPVRVG